jgi:hypothetical protein
MPGRPIALARGRRRCDHDMGGPTCSEGGGLSSATVVGRGSPGGHPGKGTEVPRQLAARRAARTRSSAAWLRT